jgi:hypothetical protein
MKGMGFGHEIWQVKGNEWAKFWNMDNIKVNLKEYDGEASLWLRTVRACGF